ncbi:MAG TPA: hypothetical protein VLH16_07710, partial [Bacteroidales bacterium]|nr:hypothetical protein [Bacteroidales bacterium]
MPETCKKSASGSYINQYYDLCILKTIQMEFIIHLTQIIITPAIVVLAVYFVLNRMLKREADARSEQQRAGFSQTVLPLRLQAYERIVILLERISPSQLLIRLNHPGITAGQMQWQMLKSIREEF